jgi:hypothetical protein
MDGEDKKYYGKLLKRLGFVVGSVFLIGYGFNKCGNEKISFGNLEENIQNFEFKDDSSKVFKEYPVNFKK